MQEKLKSRWIFVKNKWDELEKEQKIKFSIATAIVFITIFSLVYIMTRPTMVILINNEEYQTIIDAQSALESSGISSNLINGSKGLEVKEEDAPRARLALTGVNFSDSAFTFADAIDLVGIGSSEMYKRQGLIENRESKIAEAIKSIDGVENANVILDLPDSTYLFDEKEPTASVTLYLSKSLSSAQANTIGRLIEASVVGGIKKENITVADQNGELVYGGEDEFLTSGRNAEEELAVRNRIIKDIESHLKGLYDDVTVSTNLQFDRNNVESRSLVYGTNDDSNLGFIQQQTLDQSTAESTQDSGEVGVNANDEIPNYQLQGSGGYNGSSNSESTNYIYNETETFQSFTPGRIDIDNSSVTVVLYKYRMYDEKYLTDNDLLEGQTWKQFKENIREVPLDLEENVLELVRNAANVNNVHVSGYEVPIFVDNEPRPVNVQEIVIFSILALLLVLLAIIAIRNTKVETVEEIEPELAVEDLLISSQMEENKNNDSVNEIEVKEEDEMKAQLNKFVLDKPETAARLLRGWLNEDWE